MDEPIRGKVLDCLAPQHSCVGTQCADGSGEGRWSRSAAPPPLHLQTPALLALDNCCLSYVSLFSVPESIIKTIVI